MESRKHSGTISPAETAELEELVFDLVRERLLNAVGVGGMWTLQFRNASDTDSLFGEAIAEFIARDIAGQVSAPSVSLASRSTATAPEVGEEEPVGSDLDVDTQPEVEQEIAVEGTEWSDSPVPTEASNVEEVEREEHHIFRRRKAA